MWIFEGAKVQKKSKIFPNFLKTSGEKDVISKQEIFLFYRKMDKNSKILHSNLKKIQEGVQNFTNFAA